MDEASSILRQMSLRDKIGQMVLCGFEGKETGDGIRELIRDYRIGGVIYFARNVESPEQLARMSEALQLAASEAGVPPLFVSIDQEGGMVARVTEGVALMPGAMALAAAGSLEGVYEAHRISGLELRAMGINLNYAPVLDINNNPNNPVIGVRSFSDLPERAAKFGAAAIRGLQHADVAATAKHFPGHGDTDVDSHLDLPIVPHDRDRMERMELIPFRRAIEEGVDAIMSAHIYFPALEREKLPVTLSHRVLTGLLREELGYGGVVMTDCMEMHAISEHYGTVPAAVMAVEAGADIVLISHRADLQRGAVEAIEEAVRSGRLSEARIDASVRRILALKAKRNIGYGVGSPQGGIGLQDVGMDRHMALARRLSEASVTLVRNEGGTLPLRQARTLVITVAPAVLTMVDETFEQAAERVSLGAALIQAGLADVEDVVLPLGEVEASLEKLRALASADTTEQIVIATYNAQFQPAQQQLVASLAALGKPVTIVAQRVPYDLLQLPQVAAYVALYESRPLALKSCARAMLGVIPFRGRLPVTINDYYPSNWGIQT